MPGIRVRKDWRSVTTRGGSECDFPTLFLLFTVARTSVAFRILQESVKLAKKIDLHWLFLLGLREGLNHFYLSGL